MDQPASQPEPPAPSSPPLPHFEPVASRPDGTPTTADKTSPLTDDDWIRIGTMRRGNTELSCLGWALVLIGTTLIAATYYWGVTYGNLFAPAGIRGDIVGAALLLIGLAVGATFMFLPAQRRAGLGTDATDQDVDHLVHHTNGQVLLAQILAGVGFALMLLGIAWITYWLRTSYLQDADLRSSVGGTDIATYFIGAPLVVLGAVVAAYFLGRLPAARRARNAAVLLMVQRHAGPAPQMASGAPTLSGVTEKQIQDLMKRLDGLMAQLPDAAVTEFSKTQEADTYLKLLGP